jgi:hypothetical protein
MLPVIRLGIACLSYSFLNNSRLTIVFAARKSKDQLDWNRTWKRLDFACAQLNLRRFSLQCEQFNSANHCQNVIVKLSLSSCHCQNVIVKMPLSKCHCQNVIVKMSLSTCHCQHVIVNMPLSKCHCHCNFFYLVLEVIK